MATGSDSQYGDWVERWGEFPDDDGNIIWHDGVWDPDDAHRVDIFTMQFPEGHYRPESADDQGYRTFGYFDTDLMDLDHFVEHEMDKERYA